MKGKQNIVLLFGGRSTEHEVSIRSARSIYEALDKKRYNVIPVAISKSGTWLRGPQVLQALESGTAVLDAPEHTTLLPDPNSQQLVSVGKQEVMAGIQGSDEISVVIPILHGRYGEDGTVQGLFEMANVAYVGCGVLGSALGLDKAKQKEIFQYYKLPIAQFWSGYRREWLTDKVGFENRVDTHFGSKYPLFVKPSNTGSSVGITKVKNRGELSAAIEFAARFDTKIVIEEGLPNIREIEVSVLGNLEPRSSVCGEIIPANEFYDYSAKYEDDRSRLVIPAELPDALANEIREAAIRAFLALECRGLSRVDFFVSNEDQPRYWINEINTLPGFTSISMYPKLWEASGVGYKELVETLIQLALEEWQEKQQLDTSKD